MVSWLLVIVFTLIAIVLLLGKGAFLIAGYNTLNPKEKKKYNEKKICRIMGVATGCMALCLLLCSIYGYDLPKGLQCLLPWGILIPILVAIILTNTIGKATIEDEEIEDSKKNKRNILWTVGFVTVIGVIVTFILFMGDVSVDVTKEKITLDASGVSQRTIAYDEISSIEYVDNYDIGSRIGGIDSFALQAGKFKNDDLGRYRLYSYTDCKSYVIITTEQESFVFNQGSKEKTKRLYQEIIDIRGE
ncbi:MAG: DUF3784 domain-containing protein [Coprobacillaceae bacterium]